MPSASTRKSIRNHNLLGLLLGLVLVAGVGGWAVSAQISGAVIAPGLLVVDSNVKQVQHPNGGIVGEIFVRDGDRVKAGDVLVRLDATQTKANLTINTKAIDQLEARRARLSAERDGLENINFTEALLGRADLPEISELMQSEQKLFELRRDARRGQKAQLEERIEQLTLEIGGLEAQAKAKKQEVDLIQRELGGAQKLWQQQLIPIAKLTELERESTRIEGEKAALQASAAKERGRISEIRMQVIQIDRELSSEVARELADINAKLGELEERRIAANDQLKRIDIRAPQDGVIHQSTVHTVGGVIAAGAELMVIVPGSDSLTVEAKVSPQDIDQLHLQQEANLRFSAFSQTNTPEINGVVSRISADVTEDRSSGARFYTIRISMPEAEVARLGDVSLVPGMPVESFIKTEERTVMSYLVKPIRDQIARAFRED